MEECSESSEQLLEDDGSDHEIDGDQVFVIQHDDLENDHEQVFSLENIDLENDGEQLGIVSDDLENDNEEVLVIGSNDPENDNDQVLDFESTGHDNNGDQLLDSENNDHENHEFQGNGYPAPVVGMEFESYDDAYNYYNCYAKELGFAIRVKSSWTKRNSKEKRGAVLCCNCEGFKTMKEASSRRKETRTGCLAMLRLRLVEFNRWRVDEVKLEHNHLFDPERAQNSKSHKKMDVVAKRKPEPALDVEVQTIKLYRTPAMDSAGYGSSNERERESSNHVDQSKRMKIEKEDLQTITNYFCQMQLKNPNFFYVMDINDEGYLRNVLWLDSRSRAAYGYFGDVVVIDTACMSNKYDIPLLVFVGVNHHGQSILLGCCLVADVTLESYTWLLRAWLTCMSGRTPQTIISDQCKALQGAIAEVFPRTHHRFCLSLVMKTILEKLENFQEPEMVRTILSRAVYSSMKVDEFEIAWEDMIQRFGLGDNELLQNLYVERERWAPVYSKDTFFAGMSTNQAFFDGFVHEKTSLKEFFDVYNAILEKKHKKEALDDFESRQEKPMLKTTCNFELQISELYTKEMFLKFQEELLMMSNCISVTQIHTIGAAAITYMVKEGEAEGSMVEVRNFEVMYDKIGVEIRCICSCFNFRGYLCRHALCVLNYEGVAEIPSQYILSRWRKDIKRFYALDIGSNDIDITNPVQWFDHLYRRGLQAVEEGMKSQDHYMVAWQAFKESLNKVRLVADKRA